MSGRMQELMMACRLARGRNAGLYRVEDEHREYKVKADWPLAPGRRIQTR